MTLTDEIEKENSILLKKIRDVYWQQINGTDNKIKIPTFQQHFMDNGEYELMDSL